MSALARRHSRRPIALGVLSIGFFWLLSGCGGGDPAPTQQTRTDSVSTTIGPAGGQVVTPNGGAGVQIPAGALGQQVTVTVTKLPTPATPGQGPLPSALNQYGPFYEISTSPTIAQLGDSVRVGVCQVTDPSSPFYAPEASHERLRLAHTVGAATEILEPVGVNDFLQCTGVTADAGSSGHSTSWGRALASFGNRVLGFLSPQTLNAAHGGLGGKVKSFSPFAAVDPLTGLIVGPEFAIAATAAEEEFGGVSYDGTNYLVGLQSRNGQGQSAVAAQLVSATGTLVGSQIVVSAASADPPRVAFDGTSHLMVWTTFQNIVQMLGQFVNRNGALVGSPFVVVPPSLGNLSGATALVFGGGTYFVAYSRAADTTFADFKFRTFGRTISAAGAVGPQLNLSSGLTSDGFNNVAFDGTNFLTVYTDGNAVKGRFVSAAGAIGQEVTIATSGPFATIVAIGFNGTNYLVTLSVGATGLDAFVQLVSPAGALIGGPVSIAKNSGDEFPVGVTTSGSNFLVSYLDASTTVGQFFVRARFVSGAGAVRGPAFTIASPANNKVPAGLVFNFNGTKYFELLRRGVQNPADPKDLGAWTQKDLFAALLTIPIPP